MKFQLGGEVFQLRRFVTLAILLFFTIPFGLSVVGCGHHSTAVIYCNSGDSGLAAGQLDTLTISTYSITGESLNYGQIGTTLSATGQDCKGASVSVSHVVYGTSDMSFADINPTTGQVCGGTWNRNTGGGIADYTFCTPPTAAALATANGTSKYLAYVTATAGGVVSNAIPVYIHPIATSIVFGQSASKCTTDTSGRFIDPDTTCCPPSPTTVITNAPSYTGTACVSQNNYVQIAARIYQNNTTNPTDNITCQAGHVTWATQGGANVVTLDENGVATALQPGSVSVTAQLSNSSSASSIGFFSTCPPASIQLTPVGHSGATNITVPLNNTQPFTVSILDTNNQPITGLALEYESTQPQTLPPGAGSVTPVYPGTATITALCLPPTCNSAPFSQIGYLGNGKPVTSNGVTITTAGASSNVLFMGSTQSQYIYPVDFTTGLPGSLVKLPYIPNSMVISQDGSSIYLGSPQGLMTYTTASNAVAGPNVAIQGTVLSVSPDGSTVVVADPTRDTTSLVASGAVSTSYGAVGTHASWTPDSQTVYITTTDNRLLTHSVYTNWQVTALQDPSSPSNDTVYNDVAVTVPSLGAYFAGSPYTDGRSYCSLTTQPATPPVPPTETNLFSPVADRQAVAMDRIAATSDGLHILGASATAGFSDLVLTYPTGTTQPNGPQSCTYTVPGTSTTPATPPPATTFASTPHTFAFAGVTPTQITGVSPDTNSQLAFVTFYGTSNGKIPYYVPSTSGAGTLSYFTFTNTGTAVTAPVAGVWSTDNLTFYAGTAGDNKVHLLTVSYPSGGGAPVITDSSQISPGLPDATGTTIVVPDLIVQHPKKVTN